MEHKMEMIEAIARLSRVMRRRSKAQEPLSYMGHYVLRMIMENDGIRATELARLADIRPASVTQVVNRLEQQGYVVRKKDDADSRAKRIYITDQTREHIEAHTKEKQVRNERMRSCLTEEESDAFLATCEKLCVFLESDNL